MSRLLERGVSGGDAAARRDVVHARLRTPGGLELEVERRSEEVPPAWLDVSLSASVLGLAADSLGSDEDECWDRLRLAALPGDSLSRDGVCRRLNDFRWLIEALSRRIERMHRRAEEVAVDVTLGRNLRRELEEICVSFGLACDSEFVPGCSRLYRLSRDSSDSWSWHV